MENLSTEHLLSLVNLTLIDGEGVHYHYDEETQFYNQCHSDADGKFCSGGPVSGRAELRDSDGKASPIEGPVKRGPHGGSLVNPHDGTNTFDGLKGYDKTTGKPVPGTDAWLEAHGVSRKIFDSRPYVKFEADKTDPALQEAFKRGTPGAKQWDRLAGQEGQDGGYIMYKHQIPDSPYGEIEPQVRPNEGAITNYSKRKQKEVQLANAKQRYQDLKTKITPNDLVVEQKAQIKKAELNLERTKKATPETIRAEAHKNLEDATSAYAKAKTTKDPDIIAEARKDLATAKREVAPAEYKAGKFREEAAIYHAQKQVDSAKQRLSDIQEDPKAFLAGEIIRQGGKDGKGGRIKRAENAYKGEKAKYLFTKDGDVARIDINPDKQNVKNLMEGKGRIYFAMEGSIKNDAVMAAVKREDPTAAVVNVPSVTLWHNKNATEGEISWFARTHGKDRQIVLIPDADGVNNVNVMRQANALASALKTGGARQVLVAAPPVKHGTKNIIDPVKLVSKTSEGKDVYDERKGIDDHLGAGRGTLGQLAYQTDAKIPKFSLNDRTRGGGNTNDVKLNRNALDNHERMLGAISSLAGKKGAVQVSKNLLMQTSGITSPGSAIAARDKLQELGIIDVHYVFDKNVLAQSRKRVLVMPQKEVDHWVSQKIIKPLPEDLFAKDDYEASPIIVIKDKKYIVKEENSSTGVLSDLPDWKPPKTYDGWRSPLTNKTDTTGIAARMASEEAKTKAKAKGVTPTGSGGTTKGSVAKTAEQRLKAKKAPPGRIIVRTEAGAKKYGVKIGDLVPLAAQYLPSMVLLSSVMSEEDLVEFYNQCHGGKDGKFCEGTDGPGRARDNSKNSGGTKSVSGKFHTGDWPDDNGRPIETTFSTHLGHSTTIDGIHDVIDVHQITDNYGNKIKLYDKTGIADRYKNDLLQNHAKMNEMYHFAHPKNIVVTKTGDEGLDGNTFAIVKSDKNYTAVNSHLLGYDMASDGNSMPSAHTGDTKNMDYLLTHEFGHHLDFSRHWTDSGGYRQHPMTQDPNFMSYISEYGHTGHSGIEAYAEAFAEWHHSKGTTSNPAARALAEHEGWNGNGVTALNDAIAAAGQPNKNAIISLTLENMTSFQNKDQPKIIIAKDSPIDGPSIEGDFKVIEPSEEEVAKASEIMSRVLKDMGLEKDNG